MRIGTCSDVGKTRPINEDNFYVSEYARKPEALYAMVADGMGGHNAGETASGIAVEVISEFINEYFNDQVPPEHVRDLLIAAINQANQIVYTNGRDNVKLSGMGTTLTACFLYGQQATIAHVGDSRAYIIREDVTHRVTADHSLVAELLRNGQITPEQARNHPQKNVITRAVGTDPKVEIDIYEFGIQPKDIILLCTDGLSNLLSDQEMYHMIREAESMEEAATALVDAANEKGGLDNITAVLLEI